MQFKLSEARVAIGFLTSANILKVELRKLLLEWMQKLS